MSGRIKAIDKTSVHRITSSQVVVDLQTAIKELVENSLDAGATVIEVRIKEYGLKLIEVIDNGTGISKDDYETVALKHHTSKLSSFEDLTTVETFGFRGEALASLCALCESVTITTATTEEAPMGTVLQLDRTGRVTDKAGRVARQRGTTVSLTSLFTPLPVRRKEFERHAKREYGKALNLLTAYALVPCTSGTGVKLTVSHVSESGKKLVQIQTDGSTLLKNSITTLWGSKGLENLTPINLKFQVEPDSALFRRRGLSERQITVKLTGMVSRFAVGCGRASNDRQFFFVNQRPCNLSKIQKAMNEVYKTFNQTQSPFLVLDFSLPTDVCDINVSPDKRTIFVHSEENLIQALRTAFVDHFDQGRSQFTLNTEGQTQCSSTVPKRSSLWSADLQEETSSDPLDRMVSSDPLPTTQPVPFTMPSSDPPSQGPPKSPPPTHSPRLKDIATASKNSSRLVDHMSPSPDPPSPKQVRSAPGVHGRKRRIAESSSGSDDETSVREEQNTPVQTVLSTVGASWSSARLPESSKSTGGVTVSSRITAPESGQEKLSNMPTRIKAEKGRLRVNRDKIPSMTSRTLEEDSDEIMEVDSPVDRVSPPRSSHRTSKDLSTIMRLDKLHVSPQKLSKGNDEELDDLRTPVDATSTKYTRTTKSAPLTALNTAQEIVRTHNHTGFVMSFDMAKVCRIWNNGTRSGHAQSTTKLNQTVAETNSEDEGIQAMSLEGEDAEDLLDRVVEKEDFKHMEILGQFNLGFVIVRLCKATGIPSNRRQTPVAGPSSAPQAYTEDLFIVDQHAADEKYNFETLQLTTRIESQKLFQPRALELSATDRLVAVENLEVLQRNGFEVKVPEDLINEGVTKLQLVAQPVSKSTVFDVSDLMELIHLLQDKPSGTMVRCSKARSMFASRACRKSVMIGHPLTRAQMTNVVRHMGTMEHPWNCPHGRPTMRHLIRMQPQNQSSHRKVDWSRIS